MIAIYLIHSTCNVTLQQLFDVYVMQSTSVKGKTTKTSKANIATVLEVYIYVQNINMHVHMHSCNTTNVILLRVNCIGIYSYMDPVCMVQ